MRKKRQQRATRGVQKKQQVLEAMFTSLLRGDGNFSAHLSKLFSGKPRQGCSPAEWDRRMEALREAASVPFVTVLGSVVENEEIAAIREKIMDAPVNAISDLYDELIQAQHRAQQREIEAEFSSWTKEQ